MSTTIDNKVVEMRFDNRRFEENVKTTLSTIDKLKRSLKFDNVAKGFENIESASKKVNMSSLQNGIEAARISFSALDVVAVTALANITNSAIVAGKRIVSALTIDPIRTGLSEYETQINSVQTILANTQKEGTNIQMVNAALDELNDYADKTIYNFTEMTRNIGTFTAAGVDLNTSVNAIKGISNLAAISGSTSAQASSAMYQLSQALATGTVKLQDWNSVVNAGMGGKVFQDALVRTSELLGTGAEKAIEASGSFRESLTRTGWLTTEVLTTTLDQFATAADTQEEYEAAIKKFVDQGFTQEVATQIADMARSAGEAATKVKTFTQMWDVLRETAQSGWSETWRLILGDFVEAKSLFTPLTSFFSELIQNMSNARNILLEGALHTTFGKLAKAVTNASEEVTHLTDAQKEQVKESSKLSEAQMRSLGYTTEQIHAFREMAETSKKLGMPIDEFIDKLDTLNGRTILLESLGNVIKTIYNFAKTLGESFKEVFKPLTSDQLFNGISALHRLSEALVIDAENLELLKRSFKGVFGIFKIFTSLIKGGLLTTFRVIINVLEKFDINLLEVTATIGDVLWYISDFITFGETFKEVFGSIDTVIKNVAKSIGEFMKKLTGVSLDGFITSVSGIASALGISQIVGAFDWLYKKLSYYAKLFNKLDFASGIKKVLNDLTKVFKNFMSFMKSLTWEDVIEALSDFGKSVRETFKKLIDDFKEVGPDLIEGLQNGLKDGFEKAIEWMTELGEKIVEAIKAVLGIHSPSTVMFEVGQNIIMGLINGINSLIDGVIDIFRGIGDRITDAIGPIDWGSITVLLFGAGMFVSLYKFTDALQAMGTAAKNVTAPAAGIGKVFTSISEVIDMITQKEKAGTKLQGVAVAFKIFAESVAILAASVGALALLDTDKVWNAVLVVGAISAIMGVLSIALTRFSKDAPSLKTLNISGLIVSLGASFMLLSLAAKIMGSVDADSFDNALKVLGMYGAVLVALSVATHFAGSDFDKTAMLIGKVGFCFVLLGVAAKIMGNIESDKFVMILGVLTIFTAAVSILIGITTFAGDNADKAAIFISKIGAAFLLLAITAKIIGGIDGEAFNRASLMMTGFAAGVSILIFVSSVFGKQIDKASDFVIKVSAAFLLLSIASKIIAGIEFSDFGKIAVALVGLSAVILGLVFISNLAPNEKIVKITASLFAMSLAIGILAAISALLGMVKPSNLAKGILAVAMLGVIVGGLTIVSKGASDIKGTMMGIAVAIGVLAISLTALSLIDPANLIKATFCLSMVMGMLALIVSQSGKATGAMKELIVISVVVGAIGAVLYALGQLPTGAALESAASLSMVLVAIAGTLMVLDSIKGVSVASLGALAAVTAIVGVLALIMGLLTGMDVAPSIETAEALSTLLVVLSAVTFLLSAVGPVAPMAIEGALAMGAVIGILATVILAIVGLAGLVAQLPNALDVVTQAGELLQKIGEAIGKFIGGFVGGILEGLTDNLMDVATNLSLFMMNLTPFLVGVKMIDPSMGEAIATLTSMILALTASSFLTGITDLLNIGTDFGTLGEKLIPFGEAVKKYSDVITGIDAEAIQASAIAGETIAQLSTTLPKDGGFLQNIFGKNADLGEFGIQLVLFGAGLKNYSDSIAGADFARIQESTAAGQALSDLANTLPNDGGSLIESIFGSTESLGNFGKELTNFGKGLYNYAESVKDINIESIRTSVEAASALNDLSKKLGVEGGFLSFFDGTQKGLDKFGGELAAFGGSLKTYSDSLSEISFSKISTATNNLNELVTFINGLANVDFTKVTEVKKINQISNALKNYYTNIDGVDFEMVGKSIGVIVESALGISTVPIINIEAINTLKAAMDTLVTIDINGFLSEFDAAGSRAFYSGLNFAQMLANGFIGGSGFMLTAITMIVVTSSNSLMALSPLFNVNGIQLMMQLYLGMNTIGPLLNVFILLTMMQCVTTISSYESKFFDAGKKLMSSFSDGIYKGSSSIAKSLSDAMTSTISAIREYYDDFYNVGKYLVSGFANGIKDHTYLSSIAASAMAKVAKTAAEQTLEVESPSKVFKRIGMYTAEGFSNGMTFYTGKVAMSAKNMANEAIESTSNALESMHSFSMDNVDVSPRIRPVIDMSDMDSVSSAFSINGVIDAVVSKPINTLATMVEEAQNGIISSNQEMINAVNGLREDLNAIYSSDDQELALYVDSKKLASSLVKPMNRQLSILARRGV